MLIEFTLHKNGKVSKSRDSKSVVKSCFDFCDSKVRTQVAKFLEDNKRFKMTVNFENSKVVLKKV